MAVKAFFRGWSSRQVGNLEDRPSGIVDEGGRPIPVGTVAHRVADDLFGAGVARCIHAQPIEGAAGTTYRLEFDESGRRSTVYLKLPTQSVERRAMFAERLREEYRVTAEIRQGFPETIALRTVAPAGFVESVAGFATWATPGIELDGVLRARCRRFGGPLDEARGRCAQAAAWLTEFHRLPCPYGVADARARLDTYYDDRLVTLARLQGSGVSERLAADLKSTLMRMVDAELLRCQIVRCHNDYSPHNMLVDGPALCVLDFSFAGPGLPAFDLACFWHKLDDIRESAISDPGRVRALQRAFVDASATPFDLESGPAVLGIARIVLSKMITRLRQPVRRPGLHDYKRRRRYQGWLSWLESGFDPRHLAR